MRAVNEGIMSQHGGCSSIACGLRRNPFRSAAMQRLRVMIYADDLCIFIHGWEFVMYMAVAKPSAVVRWSARPLFFATSVTFFTQPSENKYNLGIHYIVVT